MASEGCSSGQCDIVVIGAGYVGLPLALELASHHSSVTAFDTDQRRVAMLKRGRSYIADVSSKRLKAAVAAGRLRATTRADSLAQASVVIVCVPTPLSERRNPDLSHINAALDAIAVHQHPGMLVIIESTVYPGMTREMAVPRLTERYQLGSEIFIGFSPERVDPGNSEFSLKKTPKVISGATPVCLEKVREFYSAVFDKLVPVSSTDTAEMVKLLENTFRAVNIGLVNEIAMLVRSLGIDPFEVIGAAATKPFGFMSFTPGPGLGGHCVPIAPRYLSWKLATMQLASKLIAAAESVNESMPHYVVERLSHLLQTQHVDLNGSKILIYGVAYKCNVSDARGSPAMAVIEELRQRQARVSFLDPWVPYIRSAGVLMQSVSQETSFAQFDAVVILTDHAALPKDRICFESRLILDTRGVLVSYKKHSPHIHTL